MMRDIRPARSQPRDDDDIELYEASHEAKRAARRQADKTSKRLPKDPNRRVRARGATVPVTKIHVPDVACKAHSDFDHAKKKSQRRSPAVRVGSGERKILLVFFGLVIVASVIATLIFLPTAAVALHLRTAPLLVDEELTIGAQSDEQAAITGTSFFRDVSVSGSVPVENTEAIGTKASGTVAIVNRSSEQQKIKEQSRLVTADGQLFYMQKHAIISPNSRVSVPIEAAEAGDSGNIESQRLNFAALEEASQQLIFAEVADELTGGTGEIVSVVSENDLTSAQQNAGERARAQVEAEIRNELPEDWIILEKSWTGELESFEADVEVGETTPELGYTARVIVRVMGFEQEQLLEHLRETLNKRLDEEYMLFPGPISYTKSIQEVDWDKAQVSLSVRVTHTTIPRLNLDTLREKLAGRSAEEAQSYLEGLAGVRSAEISLWPFWVRSIPRIEKRISLELESERQP